VNDITNADEHVMLSDCDCLVVYLGFADFTVV